MSLAYNKWKVLIDCLSCDSVCLKDDDLCALLFLSCRKRIWGVCAYLEDHVGFAAIKIFQVIDTPLKTAGNVLANYEIICQPGALLWRKAFGNDYDWT